MMKYVVCGTSVEDVEEGVKAMKMAIANGATCGVGGSTMAEVEKGLDAMKQMVEGNAPITEGCPHCPCPYCDYEDEDEDTPDYEDEDEDIPDYEEVYRAYLNTADGLIEPNELNYRSQNEALISMLEDDFPLDTIQIELCRSYEDGYIETIEVEKPATDIWVESH